MKKVCFWGILGSTLISALGCKTVPASNTATGNASAGTGGDYSHANPSAPRPTPQQWSPATFQGIATSLNGY